MRGLVRIPLMALGATILFVPLYVQAHDYRFNVSCEHDQSVVWWDTGDLDPGREYLRVATGLKHPDCSIGDYDEQRDSQLPITRYKGAEAVLQGFPPVSLICGILGC